MAIAFRFIAVQAGSAGPGALTMVSAETLLSRLPASAQKEIRWSQPALKRALHPLYSEALSDELLTGVAQHLQQPFETVMRAYLPSFLRERPVWLDALRAENEKERTLLQRVTADADTMDTIDWVYGHLGLLLELSMSVPREVDVEEILAMAHDAETWPLLLAGTAALTVALDIAHQEEPDVERVRDLLALTFLRLSQLQRLTHASTGVSLDPFKEETPAERGARALRALEGLRKSFTPEEYEAFRETCSRSVLGAS